jgi:hypothetical protein
VERTASKRWHGFAINRKNLFSMKKLHNILLFLSVFLTVFSAKSQQISKEDLLFLTPEWKGERFPDGRPKVPDNLLDRLKLVTHEEAWAVLRNENYKHQYEDGWQFINPDSVLVGRAGDPIFTVLLTIKGIKKMVG